MGNRWEKCGNCNQDYFDRKQYADLLCDPCRFLDDPTTPRPPAKVVEINLAEEAKSQAKVVGGFGVVLQVVGYLLIALFAAGFFISLSSKESFLAIVCLISIPVTFVLFNVLGSALRALALYIQVKIE